MEITNVTHLGINLLTEAQYQAAKQAGTLNSNELYLTEDNGDGGNSFTKEETLTSAVAALFGLSGSAIPNNVFEWLGRLNEYCWNRYTFEKVVNKTNIKGDVTLLTAARSIYYSNDVDENAKLIAPSSISVASSSTGAQAIAALAPCYISLSPTGTVYYLPAGITSGTGAGSGVRYVWTTGIVLSSQAAVRAQTISISLAPVSIGERVYSPNRNAYPDDGAVGEYYYKYIGVPYELIFQTVQDSIKIATGSYVGTGTYDSSNANTLTFNFNPKLVFVFRPDNRTTFGYNNTTNAGSDIFFAVYPSVEQTIFGYKSSGTVTDVHEYFDWDGNSFSWYASQSAYAQFNDDGETVYYLAIG